MIQAQTTNNKQQTKTKTKTKKKTKQKKKKKISRSFMKKAQMKGKWRLLLFIHQLAQKTKDIHLFRKWDGRKVMALEG